MPDPVAAIHFYLQDIYYEAEERGYNFNIEKIDWDLMTDSISMTTSQMTYEKEHLLIKFQIRDLAKYIEVVGEQDLLLNSLLEIVQGEIEKWEAR